MDRQAISAVLSLGGDRRDDGVAAGAQLRYLGTSKNNAWLQTRAAAVNLRNLISRGLAFDHQAWTLT